VNQQFQDVLIKIQEAEDSNDDEGYERGNERNPSIKNYADHSDIFELTARGKKCYLQIKSDTTGNIVSVEVEDTGVVFSGKNAVSEALHLGLFINKCEKELS
jgi:uncharacterized pyridoxamine 5'-phosphate oxidase family protein